MKKSLNNKIRGKRLVMGNENEVTSHEMLVEDKDGKITVKQRGADGKMESVSEGGFNIWYYASGSKLGVNGNYRKYSYGPYTDFESFFLSDYHPDMDTSDIITTVIYTKEVVLPEDDKIEMSIHRSSSDQIAGVDINVSPGAKGIKSNCSVEKAIKCPLQIAKDNGGVPRLKAFGGSDDGYLISNWALYDASHNVLYHYAIASSLDVKINPDLAESLKVYIKRGSGFNLGKAVRVNDKWRENLYMDDIFKDK